MTARQVSWFSETENSFLDCALPLIESFCDIRILRTGALRESDLDIYHGNDASRPCRLRIPMTARYSEADVPRLPGPGEETAAREAEAPFPFDLFSALRFWLADEGNQGVPEAGFDVHQRLLPEASAQTRLGLLETPIVNAYLLLLRRWLMTRLALPERGLPPAGKRCVVMLSHDVDNPIDPTDASHHVRAARRSLVAGKPIQGLRHAVNAVRSGHHGIRRPGDRHWLFSDIMDAEERHGFRSTFFFASVPSFGAQGHRLDVPYDVTTPPFRRVLREIQARGSEIGLHISYDGRKGPGRIAEEMEILKQAGGSEVIGSRHHYWRMDRPFWKTLQSHSEAGLRYDSSTAFNDRPGYRLGIAHPYRPWNPIDGKLIETVQIPCMAMDGAFFHDNHASVDATLSHVERLLDTLKRVNGVAAIDWHVRASYPASEEFRIWGEAYLEILAMLAADREISVQRGLDVLTATTGPLSLASRLC